MLINIFNQSLSIQSFKSSLICISIVEVIIMNVMKVSFEISVTPRTMYSVHCTVYCIFMYYLIVKGYIMVNIYNYSRNGYMH